MRLIIIKMNPLRRTEKGKLSHPEINDEEEIKDFVADLLGYGIDGYGETDDEEDLRQRSEIDRENIINDRVAKFDEKFRFYKLLHQQGQFSLKGELKLREPSEDGEIESSHQDNLASEDDSTEEILFS